MQSSEAVHYYLTNGTTAPGLSTHCTVELTDLDLNTIKRAPLCAAKQNGTDCFLAFGEGSVADVLGLEVDATTNNSSIPIETYSSDVVNPNMVSQRDTNHPGLNLSTGRLTLAFSEYMDDLFVNSTQLELTSDEDDFSNFGLPFESHVMENLTIHSVSGKVIVFQISELDLTEVK